MRKKTEIIKKDLLSGYEKCTINDVIMLLLKEMVLDVKDDLRQMQESYKAGRKIITCILEHPDGINWEAFALLLANLTRYYDIFATPNPSVCDHSELKIVRAIKLVKSKLHDDSLLYAKLCTCEANILLNGWRYNESKQLLDATLSILSKHKEAAKDLAYTYLVQAFWHENYGHAAQCLEFAYKSWAVSSGRVSFAAIYIAYQLSLLELKDDAMRWLDKVDAAKYPDFSVVSIYYNLTIALLFRDNYTLSNRSLSKVEETLNKLNSQAALFDRLHYMRSLLTGGKESEDEYYKYMKVHAEHYLSSDGGKMILAAGRVCRFLDFGAQYSAKVAHESLKDVTNSKYSLSVKTDVCLAQIIYHRSVGDFVNADKYYTLGKEYTQQALPSDDTLSTVCQIFDSGEVPASISGENNIWLLEYQHLLTLIAQDDGSHSKVMQQIKSLKKRFPEQEFLLEAIYVNFTFESNAQKAIKTWRKCIRDTDETRKHEVAIMCARLAISRGLYRQANSFFEIGLGTEEFRLQYHYKSTPIWLEYVLNLERCGYNRKAAKHWGQLESSAARTDQLCDIYQAHGNSYYDNGEFRNALKEYEKFLSVYQWEAGMIDERLSSVYAYQTVCYTNLGEFRKALKTIINAKECSPMVGSDGFTLEYNHAYILMALKKYNLALGILKRAQALANSDEEKIAVNELYAIYMGDVENPDQSRQ